MKVADIMEKNPITVSPQTTLRQVARIIFGSQVAGVPVVNGKNQLVGIVVEKDVLSQFYPSQQEYIEEFTSVHDFEGMEERAAEVMNLKTAHFMSKNPFTVSPQTPILRAGSLLRRKKLGSLPVVDQKKHLLGMVTTSNIFRAIVRERLPVAKKGAGFFIHLARFFDLTFSWSEREKYEIPFLAKTFKARGAKRVLDVGCGTGGHAIALAQLGFKATGIDTVKEMKNEAQKKLLGQSKKVQENVDFINIPLKKIGSLKREKFDAAIFMGNALANFLEIEKEIPILNQVLNPKATLVFHIRNFEKILKIKKRLVSLNFNPGLEEKEKEYGFLRFYDYLKNGEVVLNVETLVSDGRKWRSYGVLSTVQRPFTKRDLQNISELAGFKKIKFFDKFGGEGYGDGNEFIIAVATR